jgi:hypothetical protein
MINRPLLRRIVGLTGFRYGTSPAGPTGIVQVLAEVAPTETPTRAPSPQPSVEGRTAHRTYRPTHVSLPSPQPTKPDAGAGVGSRKPTHLPTVFPTARTTRKPTHPPTYVPTASLLPTPQPTSEPTPPPTPPRWHDLGDPALGRAANRTCVAVSGRGFCLVTTPPAHPLDAFAADVLCNSLGYEGLATLTSTAERQALNNFDDLVPEDDASGQHPAWVAGRKWNRANAAWRGVGGAPWLQRLSEDSGFCKDYTGGAAAGDGLDGCCASSDDDGDGRDVFCPILAFDGPRYNVARDLSVCAADLDAPATSDRKLNVLDRRCSQVSALVPHPESLVTFSKMFFFVSVCFSLESCAAL